MHELPQAFPVVQMRQHAAGVGDISSISKHAFAVCVLTEPMPTKKLRTKPSIELLPFSPPKSLADALSRYL